MGEVIDFKNRTNEFKEQYKVDVPSFMGKRQEPREEQMRQQRFTASKEYAEKTRRKPTKNRKMKPKVKKIIGAVGAVVLTSTLVLGGIGAHNSYAGYKQGNNPITLEQALENGQDLEALGMTEELQEKLVDLQERMADENITNKEIIEIAPEINDLQFAILKTKIADKLEESEEFKGIRPGALTVEPEANGSNGERTQNARIIAYEDTINEETIFSGDEISDDIKDMILNTEKMRINVGNVNTESFSKDKYVKAFQGYLTNLEQFAAKEIKVEKDEKTGELKSISTQETKVKDLAKTEDDYEI